MKDSQAADDTIDDEVEKFDGVIGALLPSNPSPNHYIEHGQHVGG